MNINVVDDTSYFKMLSANFTASGAGVTTLTDTEQKEVVLLVDTAEWYVYFNGTWYLQ